MTTYNQSGYVYDQPEVSYSGGTPTNRPDAVFEVDWSTADAITGVRTWTNETPRLMSASWERGAQRELERMEAGHLVAILRNNDGRYDPDYTGSPLYGAIVPGRPCRLRLGNEPVFTGFLDRLPQRIGGWGDETVEFEAVDQMAVQAERTTLSSPWEYDTLKGGSRSPGSSSGFSELLKLWFRLGESSGTTGRESKSNTPSSQYEGGATFNSRQGLVVNDPNASIEFDGINDRALFPGVTAYAIEFWIKTPSAIATAPTQILVTSAAPNDYAVAVGLLGTSTGANAGKIVVGPVTNASSTVRVDDGRLHHVVVVYTGSGWTVYVDGVDRTFSPYTGGFAPSAVGSSGFGSIGGPVGAGVGYAFFAGTLDEVAICDDGVQVGGVAYRYELGTAPWEGELSGSRFNRILNILGVPVADRLVDNGNSAMDIGTLSNLSGTELLHRIADSELGRAYVMRDGRWKFRERQALLRPPYAGQSSYPSFGNGAGEIPIEDVGIIPFSRDRVVNIARVGRRNGSITEIADAASVKLHGPRTFTRTDLDIKEDVHLGDFAQFVVHSNKTPRTELPTISVPASYLDSKVVTTSQWDTLTRMELEDRVSVSVARPGRTSTRQFHVQKIRGHIEAPHAYSFSFDLSPADPNNYMVLDHSTLGVLDSARLGY